VRSNVIYVTFAWDQWSAADTPGLPRTLTDNGHRRTAPATVCARPRGATHYKDASADPAYGGGQQPKVTGSIDGAIGRDDNDPAWPAGHDPLGDPPKTDLSTHTEGIFDLRAPTFALHPAEAAKAFGSPHTPLPSSGLSGLAAAPRSPPCTSSQ